jgi:hypothetical protein
MRSWSIFSLWWTIRASRVPVTWPNPLLMILLAPDGYLGPGLMDFRVDSCTIASVKASSRRLGRVVNSLPIAWPLSDANDRVLHSSDVNVAPPNGRCRPSPPKTRNLISGWSFTAEAVISLTAASGTV